MVSPRDNADTSDPLNTVSRGSVMPNGMVTDEPTHVRAAAAHADPYPFYARLVSGEPIYREGPAGPWVAVSAAAVNAVLTSPLCLTRPAVSPVPEPLIGTPVAEIFSRLVRMNDGEIHCPLKSTVTTTLEGLNERRVTDLANDLAKDLAATIKPEEDSERLNRFVSALPAQIIMSLLGIPAASFSDVSRWMGDYGAAATAAVTGVPKFTPAILQAGADSSAKLLGLFRGMLEALRDDDGSLFATLSRQAARSGRLDADLVIANGIGLMAQGFAGTSALIGSTLVALARHPDALAAVRGDRALLGQAIQEVLRFDPTTHSTLRFVARDGVVAGQAMQANDMIIVTLAAASRDPALNPDPDRFDMFRDNRRYLEFGAGVHACPSAVLATTIAEIALSHLLGRGVVCEGLEERVSYRHSAHVRMPVFSV
ncbi:cytochrome P450 [Mesorhizobium sp. M7D.F.Ca.US.005.01.1.1]|jgi:cytochrome P450|uniref:Cytochrome P450 n=1 Tax=Rhizobium loti TaxID=381 RepID=A0A8E2WA25_RHILI|nr:MULTISPECIES: cytochrome P450 [Mesorhizobium]AZO41419.1 cytochrome P450 [Mesorhizobium sp. M7D.F.Ca.US.005.01.1.1]PWJ88023.1 cytochrome P450 [Mesorhizobium loti]